MNPSFPGVLGRRRYSHMSAAVIAASASASIVASHVLNPSAVNFSIAYKNGCRESKASVFNGH